MTRTIALRVAGTLVTAWTLTGGVAPAGAQTSRAVENLRAFARLYGYVRYFHPSDEAAALDWDAFAAYGAGRVRDAASPDELRRTLGQLFFPVAPTLRIYTTQQVPPPLAPELTPDDTRGLEVVAWQHLGVGFGSANSVYRSLRTNRVTTLSAGQGTAVVLQSVDPAGLRGHRVRLSGAGRALASGSRVQLWLRVDRPAGTGFFDNMMDRPVTAASWMGMEIEGPVAEDARAVMLGVLVSGGEGAADGLRLEVLDGDTWRPADLANGGFEEEGQEGVPSGWSSGTTDWDLAVPLGEASEGERSLRATPRTTPLSGPLFDEHPQPGEVVRKPLGQGLTAQIPLALWSRDGRTLGVPNVFDREALSRGLEAFDLAALTPRDEALRVADVVIAWNVFQHFYPYWDVVDTDWDAVLTEALARALADQDGADLLGTLRWMVAGLRDGHGSVTNPAVEQLVGFPFRVDWIEDQLVVVATGAPAVFGMGDVLVTVDGRPAGELLQEGADLFSGSPQWRRWRALSRFGWGDEGTEARFRIRRGEETVEVTAVRDTRQPPSEPRPEDIEEVEPGVFYVNLDRAPIAAIQEWAAELAGARGVVFDLRGYPNGNHLALTHLSDRTLQSAFWEVPRITRPDHDGELTFTESRWSLPPSEPRFSGRIVFLTDARAISYAESVMGIVEAYGLGDIVGQTTAGANGNVNPFTLPGGYTLTWTGMRVVKHDGSQHHLVGIQPTLPATRTIEGVREGRDELLDRAVALIREGG